MELVKLAYPEFIEAVRKTIAKDYFMRGVHPEMQIALKSGANFATRDISALADETVRLELAGITSGGKNDIVSSQNNPYSHEVANINEIDINSIAGKVIERLQLNLPEGQSNSTPADVNETKMKTDIKFTGNYRSNSYRGCNNRGRKGQYQGTQNRQDIQPRKCRSCHSTEHLIRYCPVRFCQACGKRGHDQYSNTCSNFQS